MHLFPPVFLQLLAVYSFLWGFFKTRPCVFTAKHRKCKAMKTQGVETTELQDIMIGFLEQNREGMIAFLEWFLNSVLEMEVEQQANAHRCINDVAAGRWFGPLSMNQRQIMLPQGVIGESPSDLLVRILRLHSSNRLEIRRVQTSFLLSFGFRTAGKPLPS